MDQDSARVIADSISPDGVRLTTMIVKLWRPMTAQFNTHRAFSRNSASSRAIPIRRQLERGPMFPSVWRSEKPGMQGGPELEGDALEDAKLLFGFTERIIRNLIAEYVKTHPDPTQRLHKSLLSRLYEPFMCQEILVSSTDWDNFFRLRSIRLADGEHEVQDEFGLVADAMMDALETAEPTRLDFGEWHRPLIEDRDREVLAESLSGDELEQALNKVSTGRCTRISYLNHLGVRDLADDIRLHDQLLADGHASPFEHIATPAPSVSGGSGNFRGWVQYRHLAGLD